MSKGNNKGFSNRQDISPFVPLVLFLILCILLVAVGLLREFRREITVVPPPVVEKPLPELKREKLPGETGRFKVALIIDDVGWNRDIIREVEKIKRPLTLSLLPKAPYSKEIFNTFKGNKNLELILHLPLEPEPPAQSLDKGLLKMNMTDEEIGQQFNEDIKGFYPYIRGLNNHMGSLFTSDEEKMRVLLREIASKDLFFVDSMTSKKSKGYLLAKEMGIKTAKRDVFIDNESDPEYIERQVWELVDTAKKHGKAVGIGHAKKSTIDVLKDVIPEIEKEGIEIVPVSSLLE
jgi:uncharacterized protein